MACPSCKDMELCESPFRSDFLELCTSLCKDLGPGAQMQPLLFSWHCFSTPALLSSSAIKVYDFSNKDIT